MESIVLIPNNRDLMLMRKEGNTILGPYVPSIVHQRPRWLDTRYLYEFGLAAYIITAMQITVISPDVELSGRPQQHMPKLYAEMNSLREHINAVDTDSAQYRDLVDRPILTISGLGISFDYERKYHSGGFALFSDEALDELEQFFTRLQMQRTGNMWNNELVSVNYAQGSILISCLNTPSFSGYIADANEKLTKLLWDVVEKSANPSWMAGLQDAVNTVETFAIIEGEGVETFKKNLLIRLKDMLKPTYVTPAKYEPIKNQQMIDALASIHTRLGNAGVKAIDSHTISMIIAECENALPSLVKG